MNTELRKKKVNMTLRKLMNNSVFGETMQEMQETVETSKS